MANTIYRTVNGKRETVKRSEIKSYIKKTFGWTDEQYNKQYDILRNKRRTYENYVRSHGGTIQTQSPANILYYEARAKQRNKNEYSPSLELQRLKAIPSYSTGKKLQEALQNPVRLNKIYASYTEKQFAGLIEKNAGARAIVEKIKDPVKRERALTDYANKLYLQRKASGEIKDTGAIPFGQAVGSDTEIAFDIESYL